MKGEKMKKFRALSCFILALCLVFYAIPRLPTQGISELATGFSVIWTLFALIVIGANLLFVLGVDQTGLEKRVRPASIRRNMVKRTAPINQKRRMSL